MTAFADIGVVVLAAGASSRLGQPKQLVPFRGKTLLQHTLDEVLAVGFGEKVLVLGAHAAEIQARTATKGFHLLHNPDWASGMGSTISTGVQFLQNLPSAPAHVLVLLSDQPYVDRHLLRTLATAHFGHGQLTACRYAEKSAVPAVFSQTYFPELANLSGDQGARQLFRQHANALTHIPFDMGTFDIDTPADLAQLNPQTSLAVQVRYFGYLTEKTGTDAESWPLETADVSVQEFKARVLARYGLSDFDAIQVAVNQELNSEALLQAGDEVAFLPPFAGG